jgi:SAM-dependent methyltransferase
VQFFNEKCPKCNSISRIRLIPFSLKYFGLIQKNINLLHIAPNANEYNYVKTSFEGLITNDRIDIKQRKHTNIKASILHTNMSSNIYDLAIAWHVLEHIPQDIEAIEEVYRILKPSGRFLVSVPIYPKGNNTTYEDPKIPYRDFETVHGHYDHCRSCGLDYYKRFETVGFRAQELKVEDLDEATIAYYGLRPHHVVWCFTK